MSDLAKRLRDHLCPAQEAELMDEAADRIEALEAAVERLRGNTRALIQLVEWVNKWIGRIHRDIEDDERGRIADDMACYWRNSGWGATFQADADRARAALAAMKGEGA